MPNIPLKSLTYGDDQKKLTDTINENFNLLWWVLNNGNLGASNISSEFIEDALPDIFANTAYITTVVTNNLITQTLVADKAIIAELTVDQLDTSYKVANYLISSTADVNYLKIYGQYIQLITASTDGAATEQVVNRFGQLVYWLDATHTGITYTATAFPVLIYVYTELVKFQLAFTETDPHIPIMILGAGVGNEEHPEYGRGYIHKDVDKLILEFYTATGVRSYIELTDFVDANLRRVESCVIDTGDGTVTLTLEGLETPQVLTYTETASSMTFTWPDSFTTTISIQA
jgi:hypothetical protein